MRLAGFVLVTCLALALLQAALKLAIILAISACTIIFIVRPVEFLGFMAMLLLFGLLNQRPGVMISLIVVIAGIAHLRGRNGL